MFSITVLVPIDTTLAVIFCKEEEPCTIKLFDMNNEPVITWVPKNVFEPVVAKVAFRAFWDAVKELIEELKALKDAVVAKVLFRAFCDAV